MNSVMQTGQGEPDKRWVKMLKEQMNSAEVELTAELASTRLNVGSILSLQKGDFIPLNMTPEIEAKVDGVPVFECTYGISGGQYSLKIERKVKPGDKKPSDTKKREKPFKSLSEVYSRVTEWGVGGAEKMDEISKMNS